MNVRSVLTKHSKFEGEVIVDIKMAMLSPNSKVNCSKDKRRELENLPYIRFRPYLERSFDSYLRFKYGTTIYKERR